MDDKSIDELAETTAQEAQELMPVEDYISLFSKRYSQEKAFRRIVHNYLKLSKLDSFRLSVAGAIVRPWYRKKTESIIQQYAMKTREGIEKAAQIQRDLNELQQASQEAEQQAEQVAGTSTQHQKANQEYQQAISEQEKAKQQLMDNHQQTMRTVKSEAEQQKQSIQQATDAKAIVQQHVKERIEKSQLVKATPAGTLQFDETKIVEKLEDLFLEEIVEGMGESGTGFMSKVRSNYEGVVTHFAALETFDELPNVNWTRSIIYSRTKGYRLPQFPYLVSGKMEGKARASIDTAIALDTSSSMNSSNRLEVAKKTALAMHALMRKLNPKNNTYLSVYNSDIKQLTTTELLRTVSPEGYTRTDLALDWLIERLYDKGPSIAYLITDGYPAGTETIIKDTIRTAEKFQQNPNIMLRIFLIDGDKQTEEITRKIGRAAGPATKVVPVKNYQLAGGAIKDISEAIKNMYDIAEF